MALPLRCAASLRLAGGETLFLLVSDRLLAVVRTAQIQESDLFGKSKTCRASKWQSQSISEYGFSGFAELNASESGLLLSAAKLTVSIVDVSIAVEKNVVS